MMYIGTRGESAVNYDNAILDGLGSNGGLYTPNEFPIFELPTIRRILDAKRSYAEVYQRVTEGFKGDVFTPDELSALAEGAYGEEAGVFEFEAGKIIPVFKLNEQLFVANLSNGPTGAFKDFGMSALVPEMNKLLQRRGEWLQILGATSGDTGSAAEYPVKKFGGEAMAITMISPENGPTDFQKAQMAELSGGNVLNIQLTDGTFDDAQDIVKAINQMDGFRDLGALNSINWGRVLAQTAYYFETYRNVVDSIGGEIDVVVPSGNFGNTLAAYYARKMGLPIRNIVIATNENDVLDKTIKTGVYGLGKDGRSQVTDAPSMDITKASNFERWILDRTGDPERVKKIMSEYGEQGVVDLQKYLNVKDAFVQSGLKSGSTTVEARREAIKYASSKGLVIDTHTAAGLAVAMAYEWVRPFSDKTKVVCMSTALPVKSEDAVAKALGYMPVRPDRFKGLEGRTDIENGFVRVPVEGAIGTIATLLTEQRQRLAA